VRCLLAAAVAAVPAWLLARAATDLAGEGPLGAFVALAVAGPVLAAAYVLLTRRMRVSEVEEVAGPLLRRLRR
jgi:putative peptidoglycan lipid II flippase